jgi:hypothetical protein
LVKTADPAKGGEERGMNLVQLIQAHKKEYPTIALLLERIHLYFRKIPHL